ncbi:MAG: hypothetical protein KAR31_05945, partial [Candidatus Omnitrophica bacterium]|nr:hypothetical protein [Candidatus Omnitrophota bacterium]
MSESIIREIIIPEIEREVNEGEHFATLRQIYHSLILAKWYKETIKNSLLSQVYVDQNKIAGVDVDDKTIKDQIYARYMEAYKKGVFNYIKEDYDRLSQKIIPRKYFSGGLLIGAGDIHRTSSPVNESKNPKYRASVEVAPQKLGQSSSLAIMEGKNRLSSIKNEKYLNDIIQEAKISKGEIYPRAKEVLGAVEGDEVYILVRVPEDFLGREGLEVWIHSDLNDPNWRDEIKMDKLVKSGQDDRFIGKLKLARVGIVQYTGHWVVREDGKIIDEGWAKLPFRNGSLKNGTFVVRTRRAPVKVSLSEEEKIIMESYRKESKELGIYSRYREELFIEKQLGSFLELYKKHKLLIGEIRIGNLLNKYLLSLMKYFEKTDKNFLPSQQQSEAIEEANRILSGFYKAKIDLRPLILWGNNDAGGSAIKLLRFILLDKEK